MTPEELALRWRSDADVLDRYDRDKAAALRERADELDASLRSVDNDILDLTTAARESGYSPDRLRHKVAAGEIPNAGQKGAPRIRRGDLPRKARSSSAFDASAVAASLLKGRSA